MPRPLQPASAVLLCLAASAASATEPLTAEQLDFYCGETEHVAATAESGLCDLYITGFLDGAVATDARVAENVVGELHNDETFSERAIRTRLSRRLREAGPTVYADFCVGTPVPIAEVVGHVIDELNRRTDLAGIEAQAIVYAALRKHYPCQTAAG